MALVRQGPSPLERLVATAAALLLHLALLTLWPGPRPAARAPQPPAIPVELLRIARVAAVQPPAILGKRALGIRPARHGSLPAEVRVAEREIIDQGHGVTMTIEGAGAPPPPPAPPPARPARWLHMDVWVPEPIVPPRPSDYCVPRLPRMPERAIDREVTGRVTASWVVDEIGQPADVQIEPGAHPVLAWAVRTWVRGCLFIPAQQGGRRTTARVKQSFLFEIH